MTSLTSDWFVSVADEVFDAVNQIAVSSLDKALRLSEDESSFTIDEGLEVFVGDLAAERAATEALDRRLRQDGIGAEFVREDYDPVLVGAGGGATPQLRLVMDAIDGSRWFFRGVRAASSALAFLDYDSNRPLCACIREVASPRAWVGLPTERTAYHRTCTGARIRMTPSQRAWSSEAELSILYYHRDRETPTSGSWVARFAEALERDRKQHSPGVRNHFIPWNGAWMVAAAGWHVMADAALEVMDGFRIVDLLPGAIILEAAGGLISDERGNPLQYDLADRKQRYRWIATGNHSLLQGVLTCLPRPLPSL